MKINKKAYTELIQEDLDWLNKNSPDSLEKIHIEAVLCESIDLLYPEHIKVKMKADREKARANREYCAKKCTHFRGPDNPFCRDCKYY